MTNNNKNLHVNGAQLLHDQNVKRGILGPNCEVGLKLKALYSSIQGESIPDKLLELLEKLDQAEQESMREQSNGAVS